MAARAFRETRATVATPGEAADCVGGTCEPAHRTVARAADRLVAWIEPQPVLPRGREVPWRFLTGCFVAYLLIAIEIIGLPLGIVFGLATGEWR